MGENRIAMIGAGVMGEAILAGLVQVVPADSISVTTATPAHAQAHADRYGVRAAATNTEAVAGAKTVFLAVKPHMFAGVLAELAPALDAEAIVVSLAAGLSTTSIESHLGNGAIVVRVMPNTPVTIGKGVSVMSPGSNANESHLDTIEHLLSASGTVMRVGEEYQDTITSISGSGPAYIFYVIDALAEAGVLGGLPRAMAQELAAATVAGAGALAAQSGEHPAILREKVSSPAGTTIAGVHELDKAGVRAGIIAAARAARARSIEMGGGK